MTKELTDLIITSALVKELLLTDLDECVKAKGTRLYRDSLR